MWLKWTFNVLKNKIKVNSKKINKWSYALTSHQRMEVCQIQTWFKDFFTKTSLSLGIIWKGCIIKIVSVKDVCLKRIPPYICRIRDWISKQKTTFWSVRLNGWKSARNSLIKGLNRLDEMTIKIVPGIGCKSDISTAEHNWMNTSSNPRNKSITTTPHSAS